jgi:hypothetical protein
MAYQGRKVVTSGEVFSASDMNSTIDQTVMVFAGTSARSSAIATATAGMVTFNTVNHALEVFANGVYSGVNYTTLTNSTVAAYTATAANANTTIVSNSGSAQTIVFPDLYEIGERIDIVREGAGTVSISAGTGITSWAGAGTAGTAKSFVMETQYTAASVLKIAANSYRVIGAVA